jgi:hypothetical protein
MQMIAVAVEVDWKRRCAATGCTNQFIEIEESIIIVVCIAQVANPIVVGPSSVVTVDVGSVRAHLRIAVR